MRRFIGSLVLAALGLSNTAAHATLQIFTIDPVASVVSAAGSQLALDLGGLGGPASIPIQSQLGHPGTTSGALLPDGTLSDGLRTALAGQLLVDRNPASIQFRSQRTEIEPTQSGNWLAGVPVDPNRPAAAQLGGFLSSADPAFSAHFAIREAAFVFSSPAGVALLPSGSGFDFDARQILKVAAGALDFDTSLFSLDDRESLAELSLTNRAAAGRLDALGGTLERLTIPIDVELLLDRTFFDGLPFAATLRLEGQIVAYRGVVPEPSTALLLAGGAGLLAAIRRRRNRAPGVRHSRHRAALLRVCLLLLLACACKPLHLPEQCFDGIDNDQDGLTDCADPSCIEEISCEIGENCSNGVDDDFDGAADCSDAPECCGDPACLSNPICAVEAFCFDGFDNDGDGETDCDDTDCDAATSCDYGPSPLESIACTQQNGSVFLSFTAFDVATDPTGCAETADASQTAPTFSLASEHHVEVVDDATSGEREISIVCSHQREGNVTSQMNCRAEVAAEIGYGPDGDHIFVGLRDDRYGLPGGGSGSVLWQCGDRAGELFAYQGPTALPTESAGGVCSFEMLLGCNAFGTTDGTCRMTLYARETESDCHRDTDCAAGEVCGPHGCQLGRAGDPCFDIGDCAQSGAVFCSTFGVCSEGGAGSLCSEDLDDLECATGLHCDADDTCRSERCQGGVDDDADGDVDCDDADCAGALACP